MTWKEPIPTQLAIGTPPSVASREIADAAIENYWMALCRDVNFTQYGNEPLTTGGHRGAELAAGVPRTEAGHAANTCFVASPRAMCLGPYVSQFLLLPFDYGAVPVTQLLTTYVPDVDYMTDQASWLAVQNGQGPFGPESD